MGRRAMDNCLVCSSSTRVPLLDLGLQPVAGRFEAVAGDDVRHPLALCACPVCGIVQLRVPFPVADLVPRFGWLHYREPEAHLDRLVARLRALPGVTPNHKVAGITAKDRSTLDRLARFGFATWALEPARHLGLSDPHAGVESVAAGLTVAYARTLPKADLLVARHVLEHAPAPGAFLRALAEFVVPGGYAAIEVPDCGRSLARRDYAMIWEEHTLYLTEEAVPALFRGTGFEAVDIQRHAYPFEDVLVFYMRRTLQELEDATLPDRDTATRSLALALGFAEGFEHERRRIRHALDALRQDGPLALYGAGHLTCSFVNIHEVADRFAFVVDDTPEKQGFFLPGTTLPIVSRERLLDDGIATCVMGLSPDIEDRILANNRRFIAGGGRFRSLLAASARRL